MKTDRKTNSAKNTKGSRRTGKTTTSNGEQPPVAYEHAPIGIVESSLDGRFLNVNEEFCRLLGYAKEELLRHSIKDFTHEDDYGLDVRLHDQLVAEKIPFYRLEKRYIRKQGDDLWVELTRSLVRDAQGKPQYTVGVVLDISDRKDVERVLRESVERLRLATESARMFTWEWDFQKQLYRMDDNFEKVIGFSAGLLPQNQAAVVFELSPSEDRQAITDAVRTAIESRSDLHSLQYRIIHPDNGQVVWLEANGKVVFDEKGRAVRMFGVAQNITENKKAEESLQLARRQAEQSADRTARLQKVTAALSAALTPPQVAEVLASQGAPGFGAVSSSMMLLSEDGQSLELMHTTASGALTLPYQRFPVSLAVPAADAVRSGEIVWLESRREYLERYPHLAEQIHLWGQQAGIAVPMVYEDRTLGALTMSFDRVLPYNQEDREYVLTLARQGAQALERARAGDALRESEERFRALVSQATAGIAESNLEGAFIFVNPRFSEILGYSEDELLGKTIWELTHADDRDENRRLFERMLRQGEAYQFEKRFLRKDGSTIWTNVTVSGIRDLAGNPKGGVGVIIDIEERKRAEAALRESEARYRGIVNQSIAGIAETDMTGAYRMVNDRYCAITGYSRNELLNGMRMQDFTHPDDLQRNLDLFKRLAADGAPFEIEKRYICPDGSFVWVYNSVSAITDADGKPQSAVAVVVDVTERKRTEEVLRVRAKQQQAVARLGELAVREQDLQEVFDQATAMIADTLGIEYCKVLELLDGGDALLLRAGIGWQDGLVGHATVSAGLHSQAGYTLASDEPIVVADLRAEQRFHGPQLLFDHAVVSGMSCIIHRADGNPWGVVGAHTTRQIDFTEDDVNFLVVMANILSDAIQRQQAEQALRASEQRFREIFETAGVSVWVQDFSQVKAALDQLQAQGIYDLRAYLDENPEFVRQAISLVRIVDVNNETLELFGARDKAELLGSLDKILLPETETAFKEELIALVQGREMLRAETTEQSLDGRPISVIFTVHFNTQVGDYSRVVVTLTDITERKRIEEALRIENERFMRFVDSNMVGILIGDASGNVIVANDYYLNLLGVSREEFSNQKVDWKKFTPPEWQLADEKAIRELREHGISEPYEKEYLRVDGTRVPVYIADAMLPGPREEIAAFVLDITERKRAEETLRRNEELFSTLVEAAPFGVYFIDSEFRLRAVNKGSEAVFAGIYPLIGRDFAEILRIVWKEPFATEAIELFRHTLHTGESYISPPVIEPRANIDEIQSYDWQIHRITMPDGTFGVVCYFYDLSEQKKMEANVRASEALYRAIASNIPGGGVYVVDQNFRYLVAEGPVTEAFQLSRQMLEGRTIMEAFPDERGERMMDRLQRSFAGETISFETQFNGRTFWTRVAPLSNSIGQAIILTLDITERKQAEEAWRQSEERFALFMQHLPGLAWIKDIEGRYIYANAAAEKAFSTTHEKLYGKTDLDIFPTDIAAQFKENDERAIQERKGIQVVETLQHEDGVLHYSLVSKFPIPGPDGNPGLIGGTAFDITERLRAEEALRESEERFRAILRQATAGIVRKDSEGRLIFVNQAFCNMLGYTEAELLGKTMWDFMHEEDVEKNKRSYNRLMMEGIPFNIERRLIREDGSLIWVDASVSPIMDAQGKPQSAVAVEVNITGRKRAEEAVAADLSDTQTLRELSARFVSEENVQVLYQELVLAAIHLTRSDAGTVQLLDERTGELVLLAAHGLKQKMIENFYRVQPGSNTSCGLALASGQRTFIDYDVPESEDPDGSRRMHLEAGLLSAQSTPLITRSGKTIGMISTHWRIRRRPAERELRYLDLLARQATDLIERKQAEEALQQLNLQLEERVLSRTAKLRSVNQTLRDEIAERKRVEEALRQSEAIAQENEAKLRSLFDLLPVGISFLSTEGQVVQTNSALLDILKVTKEQFERDEYKSRNYIRADGTPMPRSEFASARAIAQNRTVYNVETGIVLENGEVVWTSVSAAPVNVAEVGVVVVTVDVTENKRAERALQESHARLRMLSQRLVEVQEDERRALARELHDRVGQTLAALNINLIIINSQLSPDVTELIGTRLNDSMKLVAETIALVRDVMTDLRPAVLDDYGLEAALEAHVSQYISRYDINVRFEKPEQPLPRLGPSVEMTFLRIAQEALMNIARHAQATQVQLLLRRDGKEICLRIQDNGIGIQSWQEANRPGSHGLTIMRERAEAFGGNLHVQSNPGQGTTIEVSIPIRGESPAQKEKSR